MLNRLCFPIFPHEMSEQSRKNSLRTVVLFGVRQVFFPCQANTNMHGAAQRPKYTCTHIHADVTEYVYILGICILASLSNVLHQFVVVSAS